MQPQERIAAIVERFRATGYPDQAIADVEDVLAGRGTPEQLQALRRRTRQRELGQ